MRILLLAALVLSALGLAGCGDDGGPRLDDDEGACVARQLSQEPPEDDEGRLDEDEIPEDCSGA